MYKIAFFDIDGTLADNELPADMGIYRRIPASAKAALVKLQELGIEPVIATGRSHQVIAPLAAQLGVTSIISSNGAHVVYQGQLLVTHPLGPTTLAAVRKRLSATQRPYMLESAAALYVSDLRLFADEKGEQPLLPVTELGQQADLILQVSCRGVTDGKSLDPLPVEVKAEKVAPAVVDIHLAQVSKATGIQEILQKVGISPAEALAFGDEENDLAMFEVVGLPVAMGNACEALKAKAGHVTETVGNHGIWAACVALGLWQEAWTDARDY